MVYTAGVVYRYWNMPIVVAPERKKKEKKKRQKRFLYTPAIAKYVSNTRGRPRRYYMYVLDLKRIRLIGGNRSGIAPAATVVSAETNEI